MNKIALFLVAALLMPMGVMALSLPEQVARDFPDLKLAGEGRLRWFGLHVYDASLWINGARWNGEQEFALDIRYARDIKSRRLVQTSLDEIRRLGFGDEQRLAIWEEEMTRVLPDVRILTGLMPANVLLRVVVVRVHVVVVAAFWKK